MRHSSFEEYGVFPPGAGRVTLGEVKAEWVERDEDEYDVEGFGRKWTSIVHEPEGLRVHGASFDVFAHSEEAAGDRFFKAAGDFVELMIQSARLGFSRGDQQAHGGLPRISFHWSDERMAVVSGDSDAIHILGLGGESELEWERPALKSNKMTNINAIAFRPFSGSTIAAGCERGIAIWRRREVSYLIRRAHTQVCGLDWTRDGSLLASASPNEGSVVLWDVGSKEASPLQSIQGGARLPNWSPDDSSLLFVSSARKPTFQVWKKGSWLSDSWVEMSGPIACCCWSRDGSTLIFAPENEPAIHAIRFEQEYNSKSSPAARSHYLALERTDSCRVPCKTNEAETALVGGMARQMAWDPTGERLAILFESQEGAEDADNLVAIYSTRLRPTFQMNPIGWVRGTRDSGPALSIAFKPCFKSGSLLAVLWANRTISFVQMLFKPSADRVQAATS
ncbi:hypothetical protein NDN08_000228 [Rhodosorus marinus]|uniref:Aladin seven-bladed propeller domain-containing protein n=1 Tax=Rhodosorus marinus TaxID=101924 RepID=A0AAV8UEM1_9RHOD|nr:hypothetical protein NDN08_000228 [Rhodosorus marinus]